jgi:hypothetical protein
LNNNLCQHLAAAALSRNASHGLTVQIAAGENVTKTVAASVIAAKTFSRAAAVGTGVLAKASILR